VGWIGLTRNKENRRDVVNTVMNFPIPYNRGHFDDLLFPQRVRSM